MESIESERQITLTYFFTALWAMSVFFSVSVFAATVQDALDASDRGDHKRACEIFLLLAEQGDSDAQSNLGWCYLNGVGVSKDHDQAVFWFEKSAEQDNPLGQYNLAVMEEIRSNYENAANLYFKSATQGFVDAQYNLGLLFREGRGVEANDEQAVFWLKKAAAQGHEQAVSKLAEIGIESHEHLNSLQDGEPQRYGILKYPIIDIVVGTLFFWLTGLGLAWAIRYKVLKKQASKLLAFSLATAIWFLLWTTGYLIHDLMDAASEWTDRPHAALALIVLIGFYILRKEAPEVESIDSKLENARREQQNLEIQQKLAKLREQENTGSVDSKQRNSTEGTSFLEIHRPHEVSNKVPPRTIPSPQPSSPSKVKATENKSMNELQKKVVIGVIGAMFVAFLFPPHAIFAKGSVLQGGYSFIGKIPEVHSIHVALLLAEWFGIAVIGALVYFLLKEKK